MGKHREERGSRSSTHDPTGRDCHSRARPSPHPVCSHARVFFVSTITGNFVSFISQSAHGYPPHVIKRPRWAPGFILESSMLVQPSHGPCWVWAPGRARDPQQVGFNRCRQSRAVPARRCPPRQPLPGKPCAALLVGCRGCQKPSVQSRLPPCHMALWSHYPHALATVVLALSGGGVVGWLGQAGAACSPGDTPRQAGRTFGTSDERSAPCPGAGLLTDGWCAS